MTKPILLVEDDPNDVFFMKLAMKNAGLDIPLQVAENGRAAIEYLQGDGPYANREQYPMPCLVLLDLRLPLVPGLSVLEWIREQAPLAALPVVVLSNSNQAGDIERVTRLGANAFVSKPANPINLDETIKQISAQWLKKS